jgi:NMD protein affecting ribosome stability and mRNA decay
VRHDELRTERVHDAYRSQWKFEEPTRCPQCGAVFHGGRWTWGTAPAGAHAQRCPACQRIHDELPAGHVDIEGAFFRAHRDEILHLVRNCEAREKPEHPLERIMAVRDTAGGVEVTTTSVHLARLIAEALQHACKGELEFHYSKEENLLRARWTRAD